MSNSIPRILAVLMAGALMFGLCYFITLKWSSRPTDDLDWLRTEFHLSDSELQRIRTLHEGYLPQCQQMCTRIASKKQELAKTLDGVTNVNTIVENKLAEIAQLESQCRANMLRHFFEVSQAMPPQQGQRYLAKMQELTLTRPMSRAHDHSVDSSRDGHH